jgi:hypothetical protein
MIRNAGKTPVFRSAVGRTGILTDMPMRVDAAAHGRGGALENAQAVAAHESLRTTKLYDRIGDEITLDEVERIAI